MKRRDGNLYLLAKDLGFVSCCLGSTTRLDSNGSSWFLLRFLCPCNRSGSRFAGCFLFGWLGWYTGFCLLQQWQDLVLGSRLNTGP